MRDTCVERLPRGEVGGVPDDGTRARLQDGVPALERRRGRERRQSRVKVLEVDAAVVNASLHATSCRGHSPHHLACICAEPTLDDASCALSLLSDALPLLCDVGNNPLCRIRGRRRTEIGDEVHERYVLLVPDRGDDGDPRGDHGTDEAFVAEGQQVLDASTAAGDDDDVHVGLSVEILEGLDDGRDCSRSLDRHLADDEVDAGPAQASVDRDVAQRGARSTRDETDATGEEGQRALALGCEKPLRLEQRAQALELLEQRPSAQGADLTCADLE